MIKDKICDAQLFTDKLKELAWAEVAHLPLEEAYLEKGRLATLAADLWDSDLPVRDPRVPLPEGHEDPLPPAAHRPPIEVPVCDAQRMVDQIREEMWKEVAHLPLEEAYRVIARRATESVRASGIEYEVRDPRVPRPDSADE